ncbi:hypothetical protein V8F20_012666 [Naviculisporaceae sp. PSN 640]
MQLTSFLTVISALALTSAAPAPAPEPVSPAELDPRIPLMGAFHISTQAACPLVAPELYQLALPLGPDDTSCRRFYNNMTYAAISVDFWNPKCLLTLYNTLTCSDPGIVSGTGGCWWPDGGIKAYKATCPYRDW